MEQVNRIFCIGRNYVKHIEELKSERSKTPVVFMKPVSSLVYPGGCARYPQHGHELHHEVELVIRIGETGRPQTELEARHFVHSFTLGIDLTLRDLQQKLKEKGLPWEAAKAFDDSALIGEFNKIDKGQSLGNLAFELEVNGEIRQKGYTEQMIFSVEKIVLALAKMWTLFPGDIVYTGTPAGVGPLFRGDKITARSKETGPFSWTMSD